MSEQNTSAMDPSDNSIIGAGIVLALVGFYASQELTNSVEIAIGVGLLIGVVLPAILLEVRG
ncbi:hypothetical protein NDI85_17555 [Halomicroarcula sp. S1AR25-4]|uniref:hypothetical protein n=1 Tax=Haloarcula sp. S1AR25-4 TaxID=2950538 RepID=UPI002876DAF2|nr:hypothetical protein [Halomicroarcula sp. S1AR25-4]MDS0279604.1 hypothetical protein [Halomicroarcula sp. S1AR25-4]